MAKTFGVMILVIAGMAGLLAYLMHRNSEQNRPVEAVERDFVFELRLGPLDEGRRVRVTINGAEQEEFSGRKEATFVAGGGRAKRFSPEMLPKVGIQYWYPCGWREMAVEAHLPDPYELETAEKQKRNIVVGISSSDPNYSMTLYVDNRELPEKSLKLGALEVPIAAGGRPAIRLPVDTRCAEGTQVSLDGRIVAAVPVAPADAAEAERYPSFLLDTTGKRSYCLRVVAYGAPLSDGQSRHWGSGQYLHRIKDRVDYVLVDPPGVIHSRMGVETRSVLNEC